jgi:alpha/beta superfamily hydrolase
MPGLPGEPSLEAALRVPAAAERAVVLCHPHPLYGGTMHSAVVLAVAKVLEERAGDRVACLRFDYRGVGGSEGAYDEGRGETLDVRAAIDLVRDRVPGKPITVCGYSFGTGVGLRAASLEADGGDIDRLVLIAPAVRLFAFVQDDAATLPASIAIFVGDDDEFCDVAEAEELARALGASLEVLPESDHYFIRSRRKLAERVVPSLLGRLGESADPPG